MIGLRWEDDLGIVHEIESYVRKLERTVAGSQKEVPIRAKDPFYIPLGFTGPEITLGVEIKSDFYPELITIHPDILIEISKSDMINYPELPLGTYWNIKGITTKRENGQLGSHSCEMKIVKEWDM